MRYLLITIAILAFSSCATSTDYASPDLLKSHKYEIVIYTSHENNPAVYFPFSDIKIRSQLKESFGPFLEFVDSEEVEDQEVILLVLDLYYETKIENLGVSEVGHTTRLATQVADFTLTLRGPTPARGTLWTESRDNQEELEDAVEYLAKRLKKYLDK